MILKKIYPFYLYIIFFTSLFNFFLKEFTGSSYLTKIERVFFSEFNLFGILSSFAAFCILTPVLEELSFRAVFSKNKELVKLGFSFFLVVFVFKVLEYFLNINFWIDITLTYLIAVSIYLISKNISIDQELLKRKRIIILIISSLIFGIFHSGLNYQFNSPLFLLISIIPYIFSGFIFGIVAIRYNVIHSIILHSLINFTGLTINLVFHFLD
ncbi:CPBP family glutamic-type intramembrane protease [Algoriphagus machipongonensis]|uniref:CAAX prenyl protease 2/Lysostaphin resistance protein A-like domain-containing protein n=1 Tax=Algoriphagus machipongonensis TaxID=388413 RepID=A3I231_9BACT|nr:hypothetical protein ALPR1_04313 [Algoriphagus machipongonensis]